MKKLCLLFFAVALCLSSYAQYVDLGLPSGTKWKSTNETGGNNGLYTYDEAIKAFGNKLPTLDQFDELIDNCKWEWTGKDYKVTGPNGNSIVLPAAGYRDCDGDGDVYLVGDYGRYWSSTPGDSEDAWGPLFGSGGVLMANYRRCSGQSVRLVQD